MASPLFVHARIPVDLAATRVAARLQSDGDALLAAATTDALADTAALRANAGFRAQADPTLTTRWPTDDELGLIVAVWRGDDAATGWPRVELLVSVTTGRDARTELVLMSPSHPGYDLTTNMIDRVWRDRLGRGSVRAFGMALAARLTADAAATSPPISDAEAEVGGTPVHLPDRSVNPTRVPIAA